MITYKFNKYLFLWGLIIGFYGCQNSSQGSQGESFTTQVDQVEATIQNDSVLLSFFENPKRPLTPAFEVFDTGEVTPKGWILEMMKADLKHGVVGALDRLYPGIAQDDIYGKNRRGGLEDVPEMGDLVLTGAAWEKSIMWWNAETTGNWWDGFIRHAYLTQDKSAMQKADAIVHNLLASQDQNGYIGIYKPNLRYKHQGSNGELWAQTTAFRTLLAYFEFTQDPRVLSAVEKAMQFTMEAYGPNGKNPFDLENAFGGVTHGLMLTDVCETLYRLTGLQEYSDYAIYLYQAFSTFSINRSFNDLRYPFLIQKDSLFEGHAVHTYEHIRSLAQAYFATGYPELATAYTHMQSKLERCILPSGAGHGNEWIAKKEADPTHTSAEYCSMLELRNSYGSLLQKTGDLSFADAAEKLTYNAMLGFRNPEGTAITYGKADNTYILDGNHYENGKSTPDPRYKYSPTHSEPAVCCVPNYGRNLSYFLNQMYMKSPSEIAILMYGPSRLKTNANGVAITIEQITDYPWNDRVQFKVSVAEPVRFTLKIRHPKWAESLDLDGINATAEKDFLRINKLWNSSVSFTLSFNNPILEKETNNGEVYYQKGPLVYAYEIPHTEKTIKTYQNTDFKDYYCFPSDDDYQYLSISKQGIEPFAEDETSILGSFFNSKTQKAVQLPLVPMGKTVLRRVTFPKKK